MRKLGWTIPLVLLASGVHAQSRVLLGVSAGDTLNNAVVGPTVSAEVPFGHRWELEPNFQIGPEIKAGYGSGWQSVVKLGGTGWLNNRIGLTTSVLRSSYKLTTVSKTGYDFFAGGVARVMFFGNPTRLTFGYLQQIHNGISNGIETSHLQGGEFKIETRFGCSGPVCWRINGDFVTAHGLNQGNPVCDGTLGNGSQVGFLPCPRSAYVNGGASMGISIEFPRRKGTEVNYF